MIKQFSTIPELLSLRIKNSSEKSAFKEINSQQEWKSTTYKDFSAQVEQVAARLYQRGVKPGEMVAISLPNCLQWEILNHAILRLGAVVVAIESNWPLARQQETFHHAQPVAIFVESLSSIEFLDSSQNQTFKIAVTMKDPTAGIWQSWEAFNTSAVDVSQLPPLPSPDQLAILIYSSGTTGQPHGILYTHAQVCLAVMSFVNNYKLDGTNQRFVCWMPLSALNQRIWNFYAMAIGGETYFVADPKRILDVVAEVSPHTFLALPRFYEKLAIKIQEKVRHAPWGVRSLMRLSIGIGGFRARRLRAGKTVPFTVQILFGLLDPMVLAKIRNLMGKNMVFMVSDSAPVPTHILEYFHALGLLILESYCLVENSVPIAMNKQERYRFGTVGQPLNENHIRFDGDSVISVKGPGLFKGYHRDSRFPFTAEGYYQTQDLGILYDGWLTLKGRKEDLITLLSGRHISPSHVEGVLEACPYIEQVAVFGSGHKRLIGVVTLSEEALRNASLGNLWREPSLALKKTIVDSLNEAAKVLPAEERPAGYIILQVWFSIVEGEVTSNQKLRRKNIEERYKIWMEQLFTEIDQADHPETKLVLVSEAQVRQARFANVIPQDKVESSKLKRFFLMSRMLLRVADIKFWDMMPHLDLGDVWAERRRERTLRHIGSVISNELANLKGPAAKLGQMASYFTETVPFPIRQSLARLQSAATPIATPKIIEIIEKSLGKPLTSMFSDFDTLPLAVASMTQIHLAKLKTGQTVAVKVLYAESRDITAADLQVLRMLYSLLGRVMGFTNGRELMSEIQLLFSQETDLSQEMAFHQAFYKIFKDDPRVMIPQVYSEFSCREVLTMEYVPGVSYDQFKTAASQESKNRAGETIFYFNCRSICQYGIFNADPHPGNYLFVGDKICFLDFGFVKRWPKDFIKLWKEQTLFGSQGDLKTFRDITLKLGYLGVKDFDRLLEQYKSFAYLPFDKDASFQFLPTFTRSRLGKVFYYDNHVGPIRIPPEYVALSRLFAGKYSILADLQAEANWHQILMPFLKGSIDELP